MSYRLLSYSCPLASLFDGSAMSGRRQCQSEEGDWDVAGESCSEVKMDTGTQSGSAIESLQDWHGQFGLFGKLAHS